MATDARSQVAEMRSAFGKGHSGAQKERPFGVGGRKARGSDSCRCPALTSSPEGSGGVAFPLLAANALSPTFLVSLNFHQELFLGREYSKAILSWSHEMCRLHARFQSFPSGAMSPHHPPEITPILLKNKSAKSTPSPAPAVVYVLEMLHFDIPQSSLKLQTSLVNLAS